MVSFFFELPSMALKRTFIPSMTFHSFSALNGVEGHRRNKSSFEGHRRKLKKRPYKEEVFF